MHINIHFETKVITYDSLHYQCIVFNIFSLQHEIVTRRQDTYHIEKLQLD